MGSEGYIFYTDSLIWDMWGHREVFFFLNIVMFYVYCLGTFTCASKENNIV